MDFEQKNDFNDIASEEDYKYQKVSVCDTSHQVQKLEMNGGTSLSNFDDMTIFEFYLHYVEKFIYVLPCSERLLQVDKDPEDFAFLLKLSACAEYKLTCEDILGPKINIESRKKDKSSERLRDFSLLAYSFNLDPAMRLQVLH